MEFLPNAQIAHYPHGKRTNPIDRDKEAPQSGRFCFMREGPCIDKSANFAYVNKDHGEKFSWHINSS